MVVENIGIAQYQTQNVTLNTPSDPFDINTLSMTSRVKNKTSTSSYNSDGFTKQLIQADRKTSFTYDPLGYLEKQTNALGYSRIIHRDSNGRLLEEILEDGREIRYSYDKNGNMVGITPTSRPKHSFILNAFETLRTYLPPALGGNPVKTEYTYNLDNKLQHVVRPDG